MSDVQNDIEVTADLRNVSFIDFGRGALVAYGEVFGDTKKRFQDGAGIRTSKIIDMKDDLIITRNSVYRVINRIDGGTIV